MYLITVFQFSVFWFYSRFFSNLVAVVFDKKKILFGLDN